MNPLYYTTPDELKRVVAFIDGQNIGQGVERIVIIQYHAGPFRVPQVEGKDMSEVVLKDERQLNAGLVLDLLNKYDGNFVARMLRQT